MENVKNNIYNNWSCVEDGDVEGLLFIYYVEIVVNREAFLHL